MTYYSYGDHEITYDNYLYGFYITSASTSGLPINYKISSEVFQDIIKSDAKGFQLDLANRIDTRGIKIAEWTLNGIENYCNFVYGLFTNAYQALNSFSHDFIWSGTTTYSWNYYFTGADPNYPASGDYGTAYGFRFIGAGGEKFDVVLDENGDYYGHSIIGNWTPSADPGPTDWILINQGLDNFYTPTSTIKPSFNNLKDPYIEGKSLHFFYYLNDVEHEVVVDDFRDTTIFFDQVYTTGNYKRVALMFANANGIQPNIYVDESSDGEKGTYTIRVHNQNYNGTIYSFSRFYIPSSGGTPAGSIFGFHLPGYYDSSWIGNGINNYNEIGWFNSLPVSGTENLYLKSFAYSPQTTPEPFPENPIPITSIPENPDDPIPDTDPDPVPGIEYPVNPTPPLPPFATIVSGNDDLWGQTIEIQNIELDLLPYLGSLSEFEFPSFTDLFDEYTASIIWVAQIMSLLYNGTPLNILFIALCLFSLVSVLIGAYKLWTGTEPDPENGGRRWKRPPKGGKRH